MPEELIVEKNKAKTGVDTGSNQKLGVTDSRTKSDKIKAQSQGKVMLAGHKLDPKLPDHQLPEDMGDQDADETESVSA